MAAAVTKLAIGGGGGADDARFSTLDVPEGRGNAGHGNPSLPMAFQGPATRPSVKASRPWVPMALKT